MVISSFYSKAILLMLLSIRNGIIKLYFLMSSPSLKPISKHLSIVQQQMKLFVEKGWDTYESFADIWGNNQSTKIHKYVSPRPLLFGYYQAAYSTFLGYCSPEKTNIEKKGGLFGLYLTYSTQSAAEPSPILLSPAEFSWLKDIAREFKDCLSIFSYLIRNNGFVFVPHQTAIFTKIATNPPSFMIDEQVLLDDAFKRLMKIYNEKNNDDNDINEEEEEENFKEIQKRYADLIEEIGNTQ
ncbi:hypothetical protein TRFO_20736 [Tritrichomonas foetus]|uniref:Uncharacterized protein n=1 Tax=Tritrichomonas foetus TaxID=1144522 RepID=A0A1J4KK98_9EUKA|nr:hypothetical protein TRFO_20736 [Tritrichomonas foetus]|eukprot:OHT10102.1 hypothetical protein TRFO_20736 [Tritrichomonas foetus]